MYFLQCPGHFLSMADPVEVNFVLLSDQESESNRLHRQDRRVLIHFLALLACPNLLPSPFSWPVRLKEVNLMFLKASQVLIKDRQLSNFEASFRANRSNKRKQDCCRSVCCGASSFPFYMPFPEQVLIGSL